MPVVDMEKAPSSKVDKPFERELKFILSPDTHGDVKGFTLLESILAPNGGCTDDHAHEKSGELMIFLSGRGRGWLGDEEFEIRPGMVMYAPPGVRHRTLNTGDEPVKIACVFVPDIDTDYIRKSIEDARKAKD